MQSCTCSWRDTAVRCSQDGRFVPNITIGPLIVDALRPVTDLPLDVHLVRTPATQPNLRNHNT